MKNPRSFTNWRNFCLWYGVSCSTKLRLYSSLSTGSMWIEESIERLEKLSILWVAWVFMVYLLKFKILLIFFNVLPFYLMVLLINHHKNSPARLFVYYFLCLTHQARLLSMKHRVVLSDAVSGCAWRVKILLKAIYLSDRYQFENAMLQISNWKHFQPVKATKNRLNKIIIWIWTIITYKLFTFLQIKNLPNETDSYAFHKTKLLQMIETNLIKPKSWDQNTLIFYYLFWGIQIPVSISMSVECSVKNYIQSKKYEKYKLQSFAHWKAVFRSMNWKKWDWFDSIWFDKIWLMLTMFSQNCLHYTD